MELFGFVKTVKKTKKVEEGETTQFDKFCPKCEVGHLIRKWVWSSRSYTGGRCNMRDCDYEVK